MKRGESARRVQLQNRSETHVDRRRLPLAIGRRGGQVIWEADGLLAGEPTEGGPEETDVISHCVRYEDGEGGEKERER